MESSRIISYKSLGVQESFDLEVDDPDHNFYCNGLVTSNSHSISYADLSARILFLKFKYPKEFFCSLLELAKQEPDTFEAISKVTHELPQFNIKLLQPSLEKSQMDFTIEERGIRYGLEQIKGISSKTLESLILFRGKSFENKYSIFQIAKECGLSITHLTALIHAGALQDGEGNRGLLALEAQAFNLLTVRERKFAFIMGEQHNWKLLNWIAACVEKNILDEKEKPIFGAKRFETFKRDLQKYKKLYEENQKHIKLATWVFEDELMGCSFTYKLKDCFDDRFESLVDLKHLNLVPKNSPTKIVVKIRSVRSRITQKSKSKYLSLDVVDDFGTAKVMMFEQTRMFEDTLAKKLKKGQIIVVSGKSTGDGGIFAEFIDRIDNVVFTKTRSLK